MSHDDHGTAAPAAEIQILCAQTIKAREMSNNRYGTVVEVRHRCKELSCACWCTSISTCPCIVNVSFVNGRNEGNWVYFFFRASTNKTLDFTEDNDIDKYLMPTEEADRIKSYQLGHILLPKAWDLTDGVLSYKRSLSARWK
jgi:hypothetical protein